MTKPIHELYRELQLAPRDLPAPPPPPPLAAALRPGWRRRVSEARAAWLIQLPAVYALVPYGRMRLARLFKTMPTHPDSARLDAAFCEWGARSGLFAGATASELADTRMGHLVYWLAPQTSLPVLWSIGTYMLWMIAIDDYFVERGLPLVDLKRACNDVIHSGQSLLPLIPGSRYFLELRREVLALGGGELLPQIADDTQLLFLSNEKEQRYVKDDNLPSLAGYLKQRVSNGGVNGLQQVQRCERGLLPPHRYFCERLSWIADLANVLAGLINDIIGYRRDIETNYPMNIIAVLSLEFYVDLATAYLMSLDLIELLKHTFDALVEDVCADPGPYPEAAAQARALAVWPDGYHTWYQSSPRYKAELAIAPEVALPQDQDWRSGPLLRALASRANRDAITSSTQERQFPLQEWTATLFGWLPMANPATGSSAVPAGTAAPATASPTAPVAETTPPAEQAASASAPPVDSAEPEVPAVSVEGVPNPAPPPDFPSSEPVRWEPYRNFARTIANDFLDRLR